MTMSRPPGAGCPECGRPVPVQGMKLCPHCGYPLMLDRPAAPEVTPNKLVYKPMDPAEPAPHPGQRPYPRMPPPQVHYPPPRAQPLGPHCPACRQVNPPARRRCEVCGQELWPGAAAPARWMPDPPAVAATHPRRSWWRLALLIGIPVALMATVWTLAFVL